MSKSLAVATPSAVTPSDVTPPPPPPLVPSVEATERTGPEGMDRMTRSEVRALARTLWAERHGEDLAVFADNYGTPAALAFARKMRARIAKGSK